MGYVMDNFEELDSIARCIAEQFGQNCEVVLHDLTKPYDQTIVAIYNGHVTGRVIGGSGTNAGLEILPGEPRRQKISMGTSIIRKMEEFFGHQASISVIEKEV